MYSWNLALYFAIFLAAASGRPVEKRNAFGPLQSYDPDRPIRKYYHDFQPEGHIKLKVMRSAWKRAHPNNTRTGVVRSETARRTYPIAKRVHEIKNVKEMKPDLKSALESVQAAIEQVIVKSEVTPSVAIKTTTQEILTETEPTKEAYEYGTDDGIYEDDESYYENDDEHYDNGNHKEEEQDNEIVHEKRSAGDHANETKNVEIAVTKSVFDNSNVCKDGNCEDVTKDVNGNDNSNVCKDGNCEDDTKDVNGNGNDEEPGNNDGNIRDKRSAINVLEQQSTEDQATTTEDPVHIRPKLSYREFLKWRLGGLKYPMIPHFDRQSPEENN